MADEARHQDRGSRGVTADNRVMENVLHGFRLFDIPVYRVSPARFYEEEAQRQRHFITRSWGDQEPTEASRRAWQDLIRDETGNYQFNQIMGWVQVVWDGPGPVIKCYYVRVRTKRVTRAFRQRHFEEVGKIAEEWFLGDESSAEIAERVREALLREAHGRGALRGRFLDLEVFDNLVPVLDLRRLLGLDRPLHPGFSWLAQDGNDEG